MATLDKSDLPPLSVEDMEALLSTSPEARSSVIVGGQALNIWAVKYKLRPVGVMLSEDVDFVGSAKAATQAGIEWGAEIKLPGFGHAMLNTAVLVLDFAGGKRVIDFLSGVLGVDTHALKSSAITIRSDSNEELQVKVMHPLHCMFSQITNAYDRRLNRRADPKNGEWIAERARISIQVLNCSFNEYLAQDKLVSAKRMATKVADFGTKAPALAAYFQDKIDVLEAVPKDHSGGRKSLRKLFIHASKIGWCRNAKAMPREAGSSTLKFRDPPLSYLTANISQPNVHSTEDSTGYPEKVKKADGRDRRPS